MDFCHQSRARSMQMPEAWESRCASKTPYGMATITMEMALLLCSKAGSVLRLVDQYISTPRTSRCCAAHGPWRMVFILVISPSSVARRCLAVFVQRIDEAAGYQLADEF